MNKKFSTLVASLLLASAVGTVSAQIPAYTKSAAPSLGAVASVADGRVYQLSDGKNVLVMEKVSTPKGDRFILKYVPFYAANVSESLWYVKAVKNNDENGVAFKFMNLAYNYPISFDPAKAQEYKGGNFAASYLSGDATAWAWMRSETGPGLIVAKTPEAYFKADSVMTLTPLANGEVAAVRYAVKDQDKVDNLRIRPVAAAPVWLNKWDLNSMLQTQDLGKTAFAFEKGVTEGLANLLCGDDHGNKYTAVDAVGKNTLSFGMVADAKEQSDAAYSVYLAKQQNWDDLITEQKQTNAQAAEYNRQILISQGTVDVKTIERTGVYTQIQESEEKLANLYTEKSTLEAQAISASDASETAIQTAAAALDSKNKAEENVLGLKSSITAAEQAQNANEALLSAYQTAHSTAVLVEASAKADADAVAAVVDKFATDWVDVDQSGIAAEVAGSDAYKALKGTAKDAVDELMAEIAADFVATGVDKKMGDALVQAIYNPYNTEFNDILVAATALKAEKQLAVEGQITEVAKSAAALAVLTDQLPTMEASLAGEVVAYESAVAALGTANGKVAEINTEIETVKGKINAEYVVLSAANVASQTLSSEINTINAQIADLKDKLVTEIGSALGQLALAILNAEESTAVAARNYQGLYFVYSNLNADKTPYWLSLQANAGNYLMVDTAYLAGADGSEVAGIQHLGFAVRKHEADFTSVNKLAARDINGRFNFRFKYWPTEDSLRIEADGYNQKNVTTKYWKDRSNSEIDLFASHAKGNEQNLVKVAVLGGARREVVIGSSENLKGTDIYTINDRIGLNLSPASHPVTLTAGLYYMDVVNGADVQKNGARLMLDLDNWSLTKVAPAEWDVMNFEHMPAAKWMVTATPNEFGGYPEIRNLETGEILNAGSYKVLKDTEEETIVTINYYYTQDYTWNVAADTFKLTKAKSNKLGYYNADPKNVVYTLDYLNVNPGLSVTIGNSTVGNDTILRVSSEGAAKFELERIHVDQYGLINGTDTLTRGQYQIRINDPYKFTNNQKYVQISNVGGTEMVVVGKENGSVFTLKEVNCIEGVHYYALLTYHPEGVLKKAGVIEASGLIKAENLNFETTTSAFALTVDTVALYREFTTEELGEAGAMKFYRVNSTEKAYLYENASNLLCVEGKGDNNADAMNVIPTGVENTLMPQYLIAKDLKSVEGDTIWCNATAAHMHATLADSLACSHSIVTRDTTFGRFLVNMVDSVKAGVQKYTWEGKYKRLAFLPGYITDGNLHIDNTTKTVALSANKHDAAKFAFRLVNDNVNDFLIESESWKNGNEFAGTIAPASNMGGWVKVQNGVPVIINDFEVAMQSDLFNVDANEGGETSNEEITTSSISVIAKEGAIQIAGAAGKKVVISNILGQVIANTIVSSDNATIAVPAGIVVVAIEGEAAVKAIIK